MKKQWQQIQEDPLPWIEKILDLPVAQTVQVFEALANGEQVFLLMSSPGEPSWIGWYLALGSITSRTRMASSGRCR